MMIEEECTQDEIVHQAKMIKQFNAKIFSFLSAFWYRINTLFSFSFHYNLLVLNGLNVMETSMVIRLRCTIIPLMGFLKGFFVNVWSMFSRPKFIQFCNLSTFETQKRWTIIQINFFVMKKINEEIWWILYIFEPIIEHLASLFNHIGDFWQQCPKFHGN